RVLYYAALPHAPGARIFSNAREDATQALLQMRARGQINQFQFETATGSLPSALDSDDTVAYKMKSLRKRFQGLAGPEFAQPQEGKAGGGGGGAIQEWERGPDGRLRPKAQKQ